MELTKENISIVKSISRKDDPSSEYEIIQSKPFIGGANEVRHQIINMKEYDTTWIYESDLDQYNVKQLKK